jgi:hypothetical protein
MFFLSAETPHPTLARQCSSMHAVPPTTPGVFVMCA